MSESVMKAKALQTWTRVHVASQTMSDFSFWSVSLRGTTVFNCWVPCELSKIHTHIYIHTSIMHTPPPYITQIYSPVAFSTHGIQILAPGSKCQSKICHFSRWWLKGAASNLMECVRFLLFLNHRGPQRIYLRSVWKPDSRGENSREHGQTDIPA